MKEIFNVDEAAEFLGFSAYTLRKYAREGEIPASKIGREWRFSRETLMKQIQQMRINIVLERSEDMWVVWSPQKSGCLTEGKDVPEALEMMANAWRLMDD